MTTDPQSTPATAPSPPAAGSEVPPPEPGGRMAPPGQTARPAAQPPPEHAVKRTRLSGLWVAVGFFAVILLLLLIFILQNSQKVGISYMGAHGHLPLGVALLLAAVCGVLLVVLAGTARISQLRATARKHRRADARRAKAPGGSS